MLERRTRHSWPVLFALMISLGSVASSAQEAPADTDIYCAGFFSQRDIPAALVVQGSEEAGLKNEFAAGDYVYLNHGRDAIARPGGLYMLLRPLTDADPSEAFVGQRVIRAEMGSLYAQIARIEVVALSDRSSTAKILTSCESAQEGDIAVPLDAPAELRYRVPKVVDRFASPAPAPIGVIAAAKDFDRSLGEGKIVYLNVGSNHGLRPGSYLRIVRSYLTTSESEFGRAVRQYPRPNAMKGAAQPRMAEPEDLPREILGAAMVLSAEPGSSTAIVTYSRIDLQVGDEVAPD